MASKLNFRKKLIRLFSGNTVVRRIGKNRIKVIDSSRLQSSGNLNSTRRIDRYVNVHGTSSRGRYGVYNQNFNYHNTKLELYRDYESMDMDSIINSALDIYADEVTMKNEEGDVLRIVSSNEQITKILNNLFYDILNIEFNLWMWTRNMCKYGDFYLALDIREDLGIVTGVPLSSYEVVREENFDAEDPYRVRFVLDSGVGEKLESFELAHFRLINDSNFLPYGKSMLEGARKTWKALSLMEDAMMIHRIMRAPEKRIFKIDIGNIAPADVDAHIQNVINGLKKIPFVDPETGDYNLKFNLQNMVEDYFLPVRGDKSGTEIDTLPGMEFTGIEDIEYLRNRMMAGLKVPKAFLGYDENVEGKATLAAEDVRFARTIERLQRIVVSELTKIAVVHLFSQGYHDAELVDFTLSLTNPSIIFEQEKIALSSEKVALAQSMLDSTILPRAHIYEYVFDFSEDKIEEITTQLVDDAKYKFRVDQIETEGNDPAITNESYGTKHDLAQLSYENNAIPDDEEDGNEDRDYVNVGRPKEPIHPNTRRHSRGEDPIGKKTISLAYERPPPASPLSHKFKGSSPLSLEQATTTSEGKSLGNPTLDNLIKTLNLHKKIKNRNVIKESLKPHKDIDPEAGTYLDEMILNKIEESKEE